MRRWLIVAALVLASAGALYYSERHKIENRVGPEAVLSAAAETQKEISHPAARVIRLSDKEEIEIGNSIAGRYSSYWTRNEAADAPIEQYLNSVGKVIAAHAHRRFDYKFHYIPSDGLVNAFAIPGGHVFVGKGLLQLMDSEDELAAVLGHEVEHVDHYDCNERVSVEERLKNSPFGQLLELPIALFQAGYSKEQEMEADRDGTALAVLAGYSPQGAVRLFQMLERLDREYVQKAENPQQELSQVAIQTIQGYFRSHPLPQERERQVRSLIASQRWPEPKEKPLQIHIASAKPEVAQQ